MSHSHQRGFEAQYASQGHNYPHELRENLFWSNKAAYAPGYTAQPWAPTPGVRRSHYDPYHNASVPAVQEMGAKFPPRATPRRPYIKVSMPRKKSVHFDLPPLSPQQRQPPRRQSYPELRRPATPAHLLHEHPVEPHRRLVTPRLPPKPPDTHAYTRHHRSRRIIDPMSSHQAAYRAHTPSPPPPHSPTIHIITFAQRFTSTPSAVHALLTKHLPSHTPHLYTISAYTFALPPAHLLSSYSGVSPVMQESVMRDSRARKAVSHAVDDILGFGARERRKEREGRGKAPRDVAISVCCAMGRHRSVAVAEKIAAELGKLGLGVKIRVVHVHRGKGALDPY